MQYFFYTKITGVDKTFLQKSFINLHIKTQKNMAIFYAHILGIPETPIVKGTNP